MNEERREPDFDPDHLDLATAGGPRRLRDEPLLRLLAVNWLIGAAVAGVLCAVVLVTDTAHLRSLMFASREPWLGMILLLFGFMVTMCSVAMATAVMLLPGKNDDDDGPDGGTRLEVLKLPEFAPPSRPVPVRVPVAAPRRRRPGREA